ncbi:MAG: hypothetical protein Kow0077_07060 [Anaerolineae bacterium]
MLILLLAAWLRIHLVFAPAPFEVDEALFASFARQISHENNPLLSNLPVDKPPLTFYLMAGAFKLFGTPSDWAARIPGFAASMLSLAVLWRFVYMVYQERITANLTLVLAAIAPLDIFLGSSAFTDPVMALGILSGLGLTIRGRWTTAGLAAGLAFASKPTALQFIPLVILAGIIKHPPSRQQLARFGLGLITMVGLTFVWDIARTAPAGWWSLGSTNNSPGRLIRADELGERFAAWGENLALATGISPAILVPLVGGSLLVGKRTQIDSKIVFDRLLGAYLVAYLLLYVFVAFNTYPRYAHLPGLLALILLARGGRRLVALSRRRAGLWGILLVSGSLAFSAVWQPLALMRGDSSLQRNRQQHTGIVEVAAYLNQLPPGTIVYDRWVGWLLDWYTGQQRPPDMWLRRVYFPTPEELAAGATAQPDPAPRYFVVPDWVNAAPWMAALDAAGFAPQVTTRFGHFQIVRLEPPAGAPATG